MRKSGIFRNIINHVAKRKEASKLNFDTTFLREKVSDVKAILHSQVFVELICSLYTTSSTVSLQKVNLCKENDENLIV